MFANNKRLGKKGSSGILQFIISKMPYHDIYIEVCMGTGLIMATKKKAKVNIGIDKDLSILHQTNFTDDYQILHGNAIIFLRSIIDKYNDGRSKILIYLDPPYLPETRKGFDTCKYEHEMVPQDHIRLLDIITNLSMLHGNLYFMISGYASQLYKSILEHRHNWKCFSKNTTTHRGSLRTEHLWTSFNPDEFIKHDYNYVGSDYTERQRIKRKGKRWIDNLESMPFDERYYIVNQILHRYDQLESTIAIGDEAYINK